jgi:nucleoside-diphosphate-sugar epimerase
MTSIVVTGGSGKAGTAIIKELIAHGHAVMNVDVVAPKEALCHFYKADLTDAGQAIDAIRRAAGTIDRRRSPLGDATAVIHMAGIPAPSLAPDAVTFQNNMMSTYNVFSAATLFGLSRVIWASSETLYGLPLTRWQPAAAPILESDSLTPESGYALAKGLSEQMAVEMHRWNPGTTFVGLRISNIFLEADYATIPSFWDNPDLRKWNLWSWVDARDVAQACRLALNAKLGGAECFTIAAADTLMKQANRDLLAKSFPNAKLRAGTGDHDTLLSIAKAKRLLDYAPKFTWRT